MDAIIEKLAILKGVTEARQKLEAAILALPESEQVQIHDFIEHNEKLRREAGEFYRLVMQ